jgi:hypothetical protein
MRLRHLTAISLLALAFAFVFANAGCHRIGQCEAADASGFSTTCSGPAGYVWTGTSCIWSRSCGCTGGDCGSMYQSQEICESAHSHCGY